MAALPEQVGFLANTDGIDGGTKYMEVAINGTSHVGAVSLGMDFGNARLTNIEWRKARNNEQHEFIVLHLRENREEQPRTSVVMAHRLLDRQARVSDHR